ncbi:MAG TPA: PEP/pyruvate-binding domain-containing protein [Thermodesulfovibrionales bacterium]|nr:PEP/pyruvate-binding domain-containing protein [Thermodesulfovibrionales bacterium]
MKSTAGFLKSVFGHIKRATQRPVPFGAVFERFKAVLKNNNRALEIITDMGEKLGGDYLFDIEYIKSAYSQLSSAISDSLRNFDLLTRQKYPILNDVYSRIDRQIHNALYDLPAGPARRVVPFEDITWDMRREVGGKSAGLSDLKNALKMNVPYGFVITTHAFDEVIGHNMLSDRVASLSMESAHNEAELSELRSRITNCEIPPLLEAEIRAALDRTRERCGESCSLAVRSSAEEEDGEISFAGQFETLLNVPLAVEKVEDAYKKVVASLFTMRSAAYLKSFGYDMGRLKMAVGCMEMVDAVTSGVAYSSDPGGDRETMIINSAWGLGIPIVEGKADADLYVLKKAASPELIEERRGRKEFMAVSISGGGTAIIDTPEELKSKNSLTREQVMSLAEQAIYVERYFRRPQDIEWAIDKEGSIFILQARELRVGEARPLYMPPVLPSGPEKILMKGQGTVVQKGIGAGRVFIADNPDEPGHSPKGAVLVAKHDSSDFVRLMPYVSAIITDRGTPTSHMSSLCREFRVPAIVNAGNATSVLRHGQEVTVNAYDESSAVYDGIVSELIEKAHLNSADMESVYEYRKKRYILRYVSPLNLIDPLKDNFTPEGCKTIHDVIRFIHEKSIAALVESSEFGANVKDRIALKLKLPIPADIIVIDIGGGLDLAGIDSREDMRGKGVASVEQITSIPLKAVIGGMLHPGAWHSETIPLNMGDLITSMTRMPDIITESRTRVFHNVAVASKEYVNMNMKFGYHFNILDCFCSENAKNNHIYFRFAGGATDISKRSRRVQLIAAILKRNGFSLMTKGDLLIARLANMKQDEMQEILDQVGRLISYVRKLDALLSDDSTIEKYANRFLEENYELN